MPYTCGTSGNAGRKGEEEMKKRCFNVASHFLMMILLLIGMMVVVPENAQAATQQVKFIDGYSKKPTTDQMINGMVNWYRIKLPENWKYTDKKCNDKGKQQKCGISRV